MTVPAEQLATLRRAAAHVLVADVAVPELTDASAHHLFRVLRLALGEPVTVTDGQGRWRPCVVAAGGRVDPVGEVQAVPRPEAPLTIGVAVPKADRPEWIVQKLTEVGVDRIVFLHAARSVVRWTDDRARRHLDRLRQVAAAALQQSRRVWLPEVVGPLTAAEFLASAVAAEPGGRSLRAEDRAIAIGPEGGWTTDELAAARDTVELGGAVLRVETAAVVAAVRALVAAEGVDPGVNHT